jgi:UDP-glucoronosyl and UDP-glucosyl transferase
MKPQEHHFLVAVYPGQGHINPARSLARRLAKVTGARVTLSTTISAHRHMFPSLSSPDQEITDGHGPITYIPYSDGYDNGIKWFVDDINDIAEKFCSLGPASLSSILDDLARRGLPVTCMIYGLHMHWVKELAISRGVPSVLYWPQPATLLGIYYHYFHGYRDLITTHRNEPSFVVNLPHLAPLRICDLPSFFIDLTNDVSKIVLETTRLTIESLLRPDKEGHNSMLLINTFEELEIEALKSIEDVEILPIGPDIPSLLDNTKEETESKGGDLFETDYKDYMAWLNTKQNGSVIYVSFGSISSMSKKQLEEMQSGLQTSGHPYLWVVRKNNREEGVNLEDGDDGMVLEWCNQVQVLSHPSVGCFVTHCGWNSTLESLACGVPMVAVPQWTDQVTNAKMVVDWGAGVRGEVNEEGVLKAEALKSCLVTVMGDGDQNTKIRENSKVWRERARKAVKEGGSSYNNFKAFLEKISKA